MIYVAIYIFICYNIYVNKLVKKRKKDKICQQRKKESGTFKVFHAKIEIDMDLKDGETLEEAKLRMRKELKKDRFKVYLHT